VERFKESVVVGKIGELLRKDEISWKLGDGKDIRFWEDKWLDNEVLRVKFSRLFSIANEKSGSLSQVGF